MGHSQIGLAQPRDELRVILIAGRIFGGLQAAFLRAMV
jgi:hypothetical protein